jgi:hypothetical protein
MADRGGDHANREASPGQLLCNVMVSLLELVAEVSIRLLRYLRAKIFVIRDDSKVQIDRKVECVGRNKEIGSTSDPVEQGGRRNVWLTLGAEAVERLRDMLRVEACVLKQEEYSQAFARARVDELSPMIEQSFNETREEYSALKSYRDAEVALVGQNEDAQSEVKQTDSHTEDQGGHRRSYHEDPIPPNFCGWYYAVAVGAKPGIYCSYRDAGRQTSGFPGQLHHKFRTLEEARAYMR